jgi:hypothetical protein
MRLLEYGLDIPAVPNVVQSRQYGLGLVESRDYSLMAEVIFSTINPYKGSSSIQKVNRSRNRTILFSHQTEVESDSGLLEP